MDNLPLNFAIMRNPINWVIVTIILFIGGLLGHFIFQFHNKG